MIDRILLTLILSLPLGSHAADDCNDTFSPLAQVNEVFEKAALPNSADLKDRLFALAKKDPETLDTFLQVMNPKGKNLEDPKSSRWIEIMVNTLEEQYRLAHPPKVVQTRLSIVDPVPVYIRSNESVLIPRSVYHQLSSLQNTGFWSRRLQEEYLDLEYLEAQEEYVPLLMQMGIADSSMLVKYLKEISDGSTPIRWGTSNSSEIRKAIHGALKRAGNSTPGIARDLKTRIERSISFAEEDAPQYLKIHTREHGLYWELDRYAHPEKYRQGTIASRIHAIHDMKSHLLTSTAEFPDKIQQMIELAKTTVLNHPQFSTPGFVSFKLSLGDLISISSARDIANKQSVLTTYGKLLANRGIAPEVSGLGGAIQAMIVIHFNNDINQWIDRQYPEFSTFAKAFADLVKDRQLLDYDQRKLVPLEVDRILQASYPNRVQLSIPSDWQQKVAREFKAGEAMHFDQSIRAAGVGPEEKMIRNGNLWEDIDGDTLDGLLSIHEN